MKTKVIAALLSVGIFANASAYDLNWSVGMLPSIAVKDPRIQPLLNHVKELIGQGNYGLITSWISSGVSSPINGINDFYYISACEPHECGINKVIIAVGESGKGPLYPDNVAWVQLTVNGKTQTYGGTPWQAVLAEMQNGGQ